MATLKESIQKAAQNPNSPFANELRKRIESGQYNNLAKQEGVDISGMVKQQVTEKPEGETGVSGFVKGFAKEAAQRVDSVRQNIGKVVSGVTETQIGSEPAEAASQVANISTLLTKKLRELPEGDTRRKPLEDALLANQKALDIYNQENVSRAETEAKISERPESLQLKTDAERAGATVEKIGEFFIPGGFGLKALASTKVGTALSKADDLNFAGKAVKTLIKGIGEGAEFAVKTGAQVATEDLGTQIKTAAGSFLLGLALTPVVDAVGAVVKTGIEKISQRLPERLMSTIFKTSEQDLRAEWNSIAKGKPLDKTLAREALEQGIFGSSEKMGVYSIKKLGEIEKIVQSSSKASKTAVNVGKEQTKKTIEFLKDIGKQYDGPFSSVGPTAEGLAKEILKSKGNMNPNLVLRVKRFFDALRTNSSFSQNPSLSLKQEGLKNASNVFRQKLYDAGFKEAMEQEKIFIEAIEALVKDAAKRNNKNVIGLVDLLAGGGGLVAGGPLSGLSAAVGIRAFQQPTVITNLARGISIIGQGLGRASNVVGGIAKPLTQLGTRKVLESQANQ